MNAVLTFQELKDLTGYDRPSDVRKCLERWGVKPLLGRHGPVTTLDALRKAQGLEHTKEPSAERIEF